MKPPQFLNPLRLPQFDQLFTFTWNLLKAAMATAPITLEVFLHSRFGARTWKSIIAGGVLLLFVAILSYNQIKAAPFPLFPGFLMAYWILGLGHILVSTFSTEGALHSQLHGQPWQFWHHLRLRETTIVRYVEPLLCILFAGVFSIMDPTLGGWIFIAAVALFWKGQSRRMALRAKQHDLSDNRAETEELRPRNRRHEDETDFVEARIPDPPNRFRR